MTTIKGIVVQQIAAIMSSNKTTTPALPELHIDDGEFEQPGLGPAMRAYIKRMYAGYYDVIWTKKDPHLNFVGIRRSVPRPISKYLTKMLRDKRSLVVFWTPEPAPLHKMADHTLSFYSNTATNTWFPDMLTILDEDFVALLSNKPTQRVLTNRQTPKPNFCAFIYHNTNPDLPLIKIRGDLCVELMKYKKVLCPALVMNNVQMPDYMRSSTEDFTVGLIRYLTECKFFICFENRYSSKQEPNGLRFVTQKILSAFIAGSIPIYSGYREIAELFNPAAFINADDFSTQQELIEYIKEVDNSPELTAAYQNAPPILPDSLLHNLHPDKMRPVFLSLAERALERATKPPIFQPYYLRRLYYVTLFSLGVSIRNPAQYIKGLYRQLSRFAKGLF